MLAVVMLLSSVLMTACTSDPQTTTPSTTPSSPTTSSTIPSAPTPGGTSSTSSSPTPSTPAVTPTPSSSSTTPTTPPQDPPQTAETFSLNATMRLVYTPEVAYGEEGYAAYYMEAMSVMEFRDRLEQEIGFLLPRKQSATQVERTGIDARVDPNMTKDRWTITLGNDKVVRVRAGHYAALDAGLNTLLAKIAQTDNAIPIPYTSSGTAAVTVEGLNDTYGRFGATDEYVLAWSDEFNSFNYERWTYSAENPVKAGVTMEEIAYVEDGNLIIPAYKTASESVYHTSKLVTTFDTMNFNGGYLEMRAKIPFQDIGEWVSLWATTGRALLFARDWWRAGNTGDLEKDMENQRNGGFGVEVDIFEVFSSTGGLSPNIWFWRNGGRKSQLEKYGQGSKSYTVPGDPSDYHLYSFYWNDEWMVFAIDNVPYMAVPMTQSVMETTEYYSKGRSALSLRLQNDVFTPQYCQSNTWASSGKADASKSYQSDFVIDYIRLYQCEEDILYLPETLGDGDKTLNYSKLYESYWVD